MSGHTESGIHLALLRARGIPERSLDIYVGVSTLAELREAESLGVDGYLSARISGTSHGDALAAWRAGLRGPGELAAYAAARREGATHDRIMAAYGRGISPKTYTNAVAHATDFELFAAQDAGMELHDYLLARIFGASHGDVTQAFEAELNLEAYAAGREGGATHEDALDFARSHGSDFDR